MCVYNFCSNHFSFGHCFKNTYTLERRRQLRATAANHAKRITLIDAANGHAL
jgi:hypothetical protein